MSKGIVQCVKDTKSGKEITAGTEVNQAFLEDTTQPKPITDIHAVHRSG